ncbi:hypothetical protein VQ056_09295 [Paenibacillus sp. JTLBN-2024]
MPIIIWTVTRRLCGRFEAADKLDPGDEDTLEFLDSIRQKLAESEPVEEPAGEPVPAESRRPVVAAAPAASATDVDPDSAGFWDDGAEGAEHYISGPPADDLIASVGGIAGIQAALPPILR